MSNTTNPARRIVQTFNGLYEIQKYLPQGITKEPKTVLEVLVATKALLEDEARWMKGDWFDNQHPEVDPEDPFCNSWQVCLEGAVGIVSHGTRRRVYASDAKGRWAFSTEMAAEDQLYLDTLAALKSVIPEIEISRDLYLTYSDASYMNYGARMQEDEDGNIRYFFRPISIPGFNDHRDRAGEGHTTTRTDILNLIQAAIDNLTA